jgi:hypothetical protein
MRIPKLPTEEQMRLLDLVYYEIFDTPADNAMN